MRRAEWWDCRRGGHVHVAGVAHDCLPEIVLPPSFPSVVLLPCMLIASRRPQYNAQTRVPGDDP
jgi:hypothetical protein